MLKAIISILKLPINAFLSLLPFKARIFLSSTDTSIRFSATVEQIEALAGNRKRISVLDVGGGSGLLSDYLDSRFRITVLDTNDEALQVARKKGLHTIRANGCEIPFKDNSFDLGVSIASLQYVPQPQRKKFLDEMKRVASRGVVLYTPVDTATAVEHQVHNFRQGLHIPDPWLEQELALGLPSASQMQVSFKGARIISLQSLSVWKKLMIAESIPLLNLFIPGILYRALWKSQESKQPFLGRIVVWRKDL